MPRGGSESGILVRFPNVSTTNTFTIIVICTLLRVTPQFQHGTFIIASLTTRLLTGSLQYTPLYSSSRQVSIGGMHLAKSFRRIHITCAYLIMVYMVIAILRLKFVLTYNPPSIPRSIGSHLELVIWFFCTVEAAIPD
jgi:hypothetical protein